MSDAGSSTEGYEVYSKQSKHIERASLPMQSVAAAFHSWRQEVPYSKAKRAMLSAALSAMTKRAQRAAWNAWRWHMEEAGRRKERLQEAVARMQSSLVARVRHLRMQQSAKGILRDIFIHLEASGQALNALLPYICYPVLL